MTCHFSRLNCLYIFFTRFLGEEGQDAGGLLREWFSIITREIFNPNYALFRTSPGDRVTYMINASSYVNIEHLDYFKVRISVLSFFLLPFTGLYIFF